MRLSRRSGRRTLALSTSLSLRKTLARACAGVLATIAVGCASTPSRPTAEDPAWLGRLRALSEMAAEGMAGLTPERVKAIWPEPLSFDVDPHGALVLCNGGIYLQDESWRNESDLPVQGVEFQFEPYRKDKQEPCKARLSSIGLNAYRATLGEAKRAGDEFTRAVWPHQVPYPTKPSEQYDTRWYRAAEWDGWLKGLTYYFGDYPPTAGGIDVRLGKVPSGWQIGADFTVFYVDGTNAGTADAVQGPVRTRSSRLRPACRGLEAQVGVVAGAAEVSPAPSASWPASPGRRRICRRRAPVSSRSSATRRRSP